jgi:transcriptional activator SPT8
MVSHLQPIYPFSPQSATSLLFCSSLTHFVRSASNDILRIYDVAQSESARHRTVPFTIVPGHRGGVISSIYLDPTCRFMLSSAGNRGWEGGGTEVLLGYEIGVQDGNGTWHK